METLDPHGWMLSLISVLVLFSALVLLYLIYSLIGKLSTRAMARRAAPPESPVDSSGAEAAAIAMALNLYLAEYAHDRESGTITIRDEKSSWSCIDFKDRRL